MARFIKNEYFFINEVCENICCLQGQYEICEQNHQILRRNSSLPKSEDLNHHEDLNSSSPKSEDLNYHEDLNSSLDEVERIYEPFEEFDRDFEHQDFANIDYQSDKEIEVDIDLEEDISDHAHGSDPMDFDANLDHLKHLISNNNLKPYFSTNITLCELKMNDSNYNVFIRRISAVLSNRRTFGQHGLYLDDFNTLNGTEWISDCIVDAMLSIIQKKCLSVGNPVVSIPVAWFYFHQVNFISIMTI